MIEFHAGAATEGMEQSHSQEMAEFGAALREFTPPSFSDSQGTRAAFRALATLVSARDTEVQSIKNLPWLLHKINGVDSVGELQGTAEVVLERTGATRLDSWTQFVAHAGHLKLTVPNADGSETSRIEFSVVDGVRGHYPTNITLTKGLGEGREIAMVQLANGRVLSNDASVLESMFSAAKPQDQTAA